MFENKNGWEAKKNHMIIVRVSKEQHQLIFNNAKAKGYLNASSYMRDLALDKSLVVEMKIHENNKILKEILEKLSKPR